MQLVDYLRIGSVEVLDGKSRGRIILSIAYLLRGPAPSVKVIPSAWKRVWFETVSSFHHLCSAFFFCVRRRDLTLLLKKKDFIDLVRTLRVASQV